MFYQFMEHILTLFDVRYWVKNLVVVVTDKIIVSFSFFGGGGQDEEEERVVKGDDVIVELDAKLEDLYMGGSLKVCKLEILVDLDT